MKGLFSKLVGYVNMRLQNYHPSSVSVGLMPGISIPTVSLKGLGICTSGVEQFQCSTRRYSKPVGLVVGSFHQEQILRGGKTALGLF